MAASTESFQISRIGKTKKDKIMNAPLTDKLITETQKRHRVENRDDFSHYFDMTGVLAQHARELEATLQKIATYDEEPIWDDDRDDAANDMLRIAREALGQGE